MLNNNTSSSHRTKLTSRRRDLDIRLSTKKTQNAQYENVPLPPPVQLIWVVTHWRALVLERERMKMCRRRYRYVVTHGVLTMNCCARVELTAAATVRRETKVFIVVKRNSDRDGRGVEHEQ
jgi:hypothetical protein